ncbi:hypothetical protein BY458DRAFT_441011 [Sporodiniella umbellata]|nr:hypothetical protein BY458DRAFT_441011 [Sporodiniella umbellata]
MSLQAPKDIQRERKQTEFDIKALAYVYCGGRKVYENRMKAFDLIKNDPQLVVQPPRNFLELSREDLRIFTMGQIERYVQLHETVQDRDFFKEVFHALCSYSDSFSMRFCVHEYLFRNVLQMLANEEQQKKYLDDVENYRILGCFAMTELGHSSALRELETTATFDVATDEFVINSPSVTSTKWWIGMAGQTATHTMVIAQTIIHGKNVGLNWFVVQLRDKYTGQLEKNIMAGDIGGKVGRAGLDNGWIQFREKRVPRSAMLARWVDLDAQGNFTPAPSPAVMYATLIPERLSLIGGVHTLASQALTIATRYGVVRRQGDRNQQIMDYQSHYAKMVPGIAFIHLSQTSLSVLNEQLAYVTCQENMAPMDYIQHMAYMHAISAGFKAFTSWYGTELLETCRKGCGGHAYSAYNALGQISNDWGVLTTGGGDNVVLLQQTARYLISILKKKLAQDTMPELQFKNSIEYLQHAKIYLQQNSWPINDISDGLKDFTLLSHAMHTILLFSILSSLEQSSFEDLLLECVRVAELHCAAYIFTICSDKFSQKKEESDVQPIMRKLTGLWGLHVLSTYSDQGFKEGYLQPQQIKEIEHTYLQTCKSLRSQVIGLTDAFGFPDFILKAPIARYDGNIYQAYFDTVLTAPQSTGIPAYHEQYIKPITGRERAPN